MSCYQLTKRSGTISLRLLALLSAALMLCWCVSKIPKVPSTGVRYSFQSHGFIKIHTMRLRNQMKFAPSQNDRVHREPTIVWTPPNLPIPPKPWKVDPPEPPMEAMDFPVLSSSSLDDDKYSAMTRRSKYGVRTRTSRSTRSSKLKA
jgi:hypothetical protein